MEVREKEYLMGLEKGLAIIEAFGVSKAPMTLTQAAAITGLTKASARRCLLTLCELGHAVKEGKLFRLAPRSLRLGHAYVSSDPLTKVAQPILDMTSERTKESASLAVLDSQNAVFVARSTHRSSLSSGLGVGVQLPAYCSATGRVLLSALPKAQIEFLLNRMARPAFTPRTLTSMRAILREIQLVRSQGYAINDEELEMGLRSVAVPVHDSSGQIVAALSLSVATSRMTMAGIVESLVPELQGARASFEELLLAQGSQPAPR